MSECGPDCRHRQRRREYLDRLRAAAADAEADGQTAVAALLRQTIAKETAPAKGTSS